MLRLKALGGLTLLSGKEPLTGVATQRRRLAIFAMLAIARNRGVSRDKILACLWPESDQERARHVLNQLLYAQRKLIQNQKLFLGQKNLRLNPEVIATDVEEFEAALERGALAEAVSCYAGPFLDGFFMKESPEFDHWVEEQRQRLARAYTGALVRLAEQAGTAGDAPSAIEWWRRAVEVDPMESKTVCALVEALAASGDRPGAVRAARDHQSRIRAELGVDADPRLLALLRTLA